MRHRLRMWSIDIDIWWHEHEGRWPHLWRLWDRRIAPLLVAIAG